MDADNRNNHLVANAVPLNWGFSYKSRLNAMSTIISHS